MRTWLLCGAFAAAAQTAALAADVQREQALLRMVRNDCGACHGMHLTGGLGPPITREALADKPMDSIAATIYRGRPGTPMPPWRGLLDEDEALWIARQLRDGLPAEARR